MQQLREKNGAYGCGNGTASASDCAAQHDAAISHDKHRNLALTSAIVGAVGLASIPVYWFWREPSHRPAPRVPLGSECMAPSALAAFRSLGNSRTTENSR